MEPTCAAPRAWASRPLPSSEVRARLTHASRGDDSMLLVRLDAAHHPLGALVLAPPPALSPEQHAFLSTVADILAPVLRKAAYAQRLESEVIERTRQIDRERRFTERIIDSLPVGLYVIDREYRIQAWNRKRETGMQGVSREEALGRTIFEMLHRQPASVLRREFDDVFATGRMQIFQMESRALGELRTFRISKIPMRLDDGPVTHVITIGEDITEWREAQDRFAQAEKLAAIGTLAAGVMHEINNPLATIAACAESLELAEPDAPAPLRDGLRLIQSEVHRCKGIIDWLLDFSRPKSGDKTLVDVNAAIEQTTFILKHHSRFKKLTVALELDRSLGAVVLANEEQLVQVFMSLLLNAMDAMREQGTVELRTRWGDDARDRGRRSRGSGRRDPTRRPAEDLRAVLHHEGAGTRHGTRALRSATRSSPSTEDASRWTARQAREASSGSCSRAPMNEAEADVSGLEDQGARRRGRRAARPDPVELPGRPRLRRAHRARTGVPRSRRSAPRRTTSPCSTS